MKRLAGLAASVALLLPVSAAAADVGIDGTTLIRIEERSVPGFNKQTIIPATQYLGFDTERLGGKDLSFHFFGWGRLDLADDSGASRSPESTDGNFTYGYLLYRFPQANAQVKAGRFFVYEGVAAEQVDGLYARTDLNLGFTIAAFGGVPVQLDRDSSAKGDYIVGGRLGYRYGGILDIGLSGLQEGDSPAPAGKDGRQLIGADLWLSPHRMVEVTGRSSYNATTAEVAEHSYLATVRPLPGLVMSLSYADIRLQDLFAFTNMPSLFNPYVNDTYTSYGATASYRFSSLPFTPELTAGWKHFDRDTTSDSDRYSGELRLSPLDRLKTGVSYARVAAADGIMSFYEVRCFGLFEASRYSVTLDAIADIYDKEVYGKKNAFELVGGGGYQVSPSIRVSGEVSYADNPWSDGDVKGLIRLTYAYSNKKGTPQ